MWNQWSEVQYISFQVIFSINLLKVHRNIEVPSDSLWLVWKPPQALWSLRAEERWRWEEEGNIQSLREPGRKKPAQNNMTQNHRWMWNNKQFHFVWLQDCEQHLLHHQEHEPARRWLESQRSRWWWSKTQPANTTRRLITQLWLEDVQVRGSHTYWVQGPSQGRKGFRDPPRNPHVY